jgi:hypothetical protein
MFLQVNKMTVQMKTREEEAVVTLLTEQDQGDGKAEAEEGERDCRIA